MYAERIDYGIYRIPSRKKWLFRVFLVRRGKTISRSFMEDEEDEALEAARAYRDAILHAFPPLTTREAAQRMRSDNSSGATGVIACRRKGKQVGWSAIFVSSGIRRQKDFSFSGCGGERQAFDAAAALREQWVAEMESEFMARNAAARSLANQTFAELLDRISIDDSTREGFREKVAAINALFDTHYPCHLSVILKVRLSKPPKPPEMLHLRVNSLRMKVREHTLSLRKYSLPDALAIMRRAIVRILEEDYGPDVRAAFMTEHGAIFDENVFDPAKRTWVRLLLSKPRGELTVPPDL